MKVLACIFFVSISLFAYEHKVKLEFTGVVYSKYKNEIITTGDAKFGFENEYFKTDLGVEFLYSSKFQERRYLLLNELYISKDFEDYSLSIGKKIKYWGELEGYNIADIYNQKNYLKDPFDKSAKYGSVGADITRYFDENSLALYVKFYEDDIQHPQNNTPYTQLPLPYDKKLQLSDKRYTPTLYFVANLIGSEGVDSETKIVLLKGYDTKRYFFSIVPSTLSQYAYSVNKALFLSHLIYNDIIFKTELGYTNIIKDKKMSDYTQLSFGFEKSVYEIFGSNITFYGEYYRYLYSDEKGIKNVDISEIYDNDIFVALRVVLNDVRSSEFKAGILEDLQKNEKVFKVECNFRLIESFVLRGEYLKIISKTVPTILSEFDNSSRFTIALNYTF